MVKKKEGYKAVSSRLTAETYEQVQAITDAYGMSISSFISMASTMGLRVIQSVLDPEIFLSPEKMAEVLEASYKKGIDLKVPEGLSDD